MVVDSSALISMLLEEPGCETLLEKVGRADAVFLGAPTALETAMVLSARFRKDARAMLTGFLRRMNAQIVEFNQEHYEVAMSAFLRFGKGRHPAGLNFGDCMSYALAATSGQLLLFSGTDFSRTDIKAA